MIKCSHCKKLVMPERWFEHTKTCPYPKEADTKLELGNV